VFQVCVLCVDILRYDVFNWNAFITPPNLYEQTNIFTHSKLKLMYLLRNTCDGDGGDDDGKWF